MMKKIQLMSMVLSLWISNANAQQQIPCFNSKSAEAWADSIFNKMDYRDRIGQLFMIDAFSNKDSMHVAFINQLIDSFHIGGLIFSRAVLCVRRDSPMRISNAPATL
ncbi:MAG: hypothetical protein IPP46_19780 [Bacteroidetes bacterium]|nr:hypothetical protein [Bacteroidota bacterium]